MKREVICISIRETKPDQITVGEHYMIDMSSLYSDSDGDWYVNVEDMNGNSKGSLKITHFRDL